MLMTVAVNLYRNGRYSRESEEGMADILEIRIIYLRHFRIVE